MKYQPFTLTLVLSILFHVSALAQWESIGSGISIGQKVFFSLSAVDESIIWAVPTGSSPGQAGFLEALTEVFHGAPLMWVSQETQMSLDYLPLLLKMP